MALLIQNNFEFELVIGVSERIFCKYLSVQKIFRILSPRIMAGKNIEWANAI